MTTTQTTCRFYLLDDEGRNQCGTVSYAMDDRDHRNGDGQAEWDAYLGELADGGFVVNRRDDIVAQGCDTGNVVVFEYDGGCFDSGFFGLAIVEAR